MFKYYIYKFGQFCVNRLPLRLSYRIAAFLSDLHYYLSFRDRRAVKNNLKVILPSEENIPQRAKEVFRNFGKYLVEFFRIANELDKDFLKGKINIKGSRHIKDALSKGKGAIVLTAHIGNWELGGVVLSFLGYPSTVIALPHKEHTVNELFNKQRESRGGSVIPTNLAIRRSLNILKKNEIIAVVADRDFSAKGEVLDFFGRKTLIPKGAAILTAKTGAAIVPVFMIREEDDTFTLNIEEPLYPSEKCNGEVDQKTLLTIMKQHTSIIEDTIRKHPTQWLMFRKFWIDQEMRSP